MKLSVFVSSVCAVLGVVVCMEGSSVPSVRELLKDASSVSTMTVPQLQECVKEELVKTLIVPHYTMNDLTDVAVQLLVNAETGPIVDYKVTNLLRACAPVIFGGVYATDTEFNDSKRASYISTLKNELKRIKICENTPLYQDAKNFDLQDDTDSIKEFRDKVKVAHEEYENYFGDSEVLFNKLKEYNIDDSDVLEKAVEAFKNATTHEERENAAKVLRDQTQRLRDMVDRISDEYAKDCNFEKSEDKRLDLLSMDQLFQHFNLLNNEAERLGVNNLVEYTCNKFDTEISMYHFDESRRAINALRRVVLGKKKRDLLKPKKLKSTPSSSPSKSINFSQVAITGAFIISCYGVYKLALLFIYNEEEEETKDSDKDENVNENEQADNVKMTPSLNENLKDDAARLSAAAALLVTCFML